MKIRRPPSRAAQHECRADRVRADNALLPTVFFRIALIRLGSGINNNVKPVRHIHYGYREERGSYACRGVQPPDDSPARPSDNRSLDEAGKMQ